MKKLLEWFEGLRKRHRLLSFLTDLVQVFLDRRITRSAAELAYYLTLTLFPMLIVVIDVLGRLLMDVRDVESFLEQLLPANTASLIGGYLVYVRMHQSDALLTAAVITIVIAASAGFRGILSISQEIYGRFTFSSLWGVAVSFVFSVLLVVMIYVAFLVLMTGNWLLRLLQQYLPVTVYVYAEWSSMRLLLLFGVATLFLAMLYWLVGPKGEERPAVVVGAALSSSLLTLGTHLFSALMGLSSRYSMVYGSLASIILLMMWLFFCGNIVLLGIVFNYVWWCRREGQEVRLIQGKLHE